MRDEMSARSRMLVLALCGAALCILLLACANLASLLLARSAHRSRELAVRAALGAGRERIVRQLVTESMALALFGGIVGVAIAIAGVPVLARLVPDSLPVNGQPSVDLRVLLVAAALVVLTGLTFGVGVSYSAVCLGLAAAALLKPARSESLWLARAWSLAQPLWIGLGLAQLLHAFVQRRLLRVAVFGAALFVTWLLLMTEAS